MSNESDSSFDKAESDSALNKADRLGNLPKHPQGALGAKRSTNLLGNNTVNDNLPLRFLHIPKNAGSSIEIAGNRAIPKQTWGMYDREIYKIGGNVLNNQVPHHKDCPWHVPYSFMNQNLIDEYLSKYSIFAVVRNPYTRLLSEYYYQRRDFRKPISVENLNEFVKDYLKPNNLWDYYHIVPQYIYIYNNDNTRKYVDHVLHYENITEEFTNLMKKYSIKTIPLNNLKFNVRTNKVKLSIEDFTTESIKIINDYYHNDFELFGYSKIITDY